MKLLILLLLLSSCVGGTQKQVTQLMFAMCKLGSYDTINSLHRQGKLVNFKLKDRDAVKHRCRQRVFEIQYE